MGDSKEEDVTAIMATLAKTATSNPDEGANFVMGTYKLSREKNLALSPDPLLRECEKFEVTHLSLNLKGVLTRREQQPLQRRAQGGCQRNPL